MEIQKTDNYAQFKLAEGNRIVSAGKVNRLVKSISKHNMLLANPIIINKKGEVIDGQHRLAAAEILGLPIYYVVFNPATLSEIQLLNSNMTPWTARDFMASYIALGKGEYKKLNEFLLKYGFPLGITIRMAMSEKGWEKTRAITQDFKEGKFIFKNPDETIKNAELAQDVLEFCSPVVKQSTIFYQALFKLKDIDPQLTDRLVMKLAEGATKIQRVGSILEYMRQFEDILNRGVVGRRIKIS